MSDLWVIVGLGNPGTRYADTRHNVGQHVVSLLAARHNARFTSHRSGTSIAELRLSDPRTRSIPAPDAGQSNGAQGMTGRREAARVILATSRGYMNTSGAPVAALTRFFTVPPEHLIVVHDDLDLPFDTLKLKQGGGHGGHNGLRDIAAALGSTDFLRVRVGIGRPPGRQNPAAFVLHPFTTGERATLPVLIEEAADAAELLVTDGLLAAQQQFHGQHARAGARQPGGS